MAALVVELVHLAARGLPIVQELGGGVVQGLAQDRGLEVVAVLGEVLQGGHADPSRYQGLTHDEVGFAQAGRYWQEEVDWEHANFYLIQRVLEDKDTGAPKLCAYLARGWKMP